MSLRQMQVRDFRPDLVERRHNLSRGGQQEELAQIARALLQERGGRCAVGIDLYRVHRIDLVDASGLLDVVAQNLLPCVDLRGWVTSITIPAVLIRPLSLKLGHYPVVGYWNINPVLSFLWDSPAQSLVEGVRSGR
jgi:hypothetical protein